MADTDSVAAAELQAALELRRAGATARALRLALLRVLELMELIDG